MWIVYALAAAIIWGIRYAARGRVIERGLTTLVSYVLSLQNYCIWLLVAVVSSAAGWLLIYIAIGEKNATLASFIEISYPFFVALFAWVFFREIQFNWQTLVGGALILGGVAVVFLSE